MMRGLICKTSPSLITRNTAQETARGYQKKYGKIAHSEFRVHKSQNLESSRKWFAQQVAKQRQKGGLFEDPYFPATHLSINPDGSSKNVVTAWLRPHELVQRPQFIVDGTSRFDVRQGEIGDCWFLAAVSSLSLHPELLEQVVPSGQGFERYTLLGDTQLLYCGMFWFRFWRFGEWYDVIVDDRLPTRNRHLVYMHSSDRGEFWSALLEKAYAKLFGSYHAIRGGNTSEAMEDLTGGLTEIINLGPEAPANIFNILERAHELSSLMACSMDAPQGGVETEGPMGLVRGHAYSITDVRKFEHVTKRDGTRHVQLVRLHNPWGNEHEWRGPWSDKSPEWQSISKCERHRIGLVFDNDGEFWMSIQDFVQYFSRVEFCHLGPESGPFGASLNRDILRRWEMTQEEGEWIRYSTAGGCRNNEKSFHTNPQFRVRVIDPDESDDDYTGTIIIGLMQRGRREALQPYHTIGYAIYQLPPNHPENQLLGRSFFQSNVSVARSPSFVNTREICGRHKLPPGDYMIIPSTFEPNSEAKFLLRIFSEKPCTSEELDEPLRVGQEYLIGLSAMSLSGDALEKLHAAFMDIAGPTGGLTPSGMQDLLNATFEKEFKFDGFSRETARSMVAMMDVDLNGSLDFDEFKKLWMELRLFKTMFKKFDQDQNGTFDSCELRDVLRALGFQVNNTLYNAIVERYSDSKGQISFDDYLLLLVRLVTVSEIFKAQEQLRDGRAIFEAGDFLRTVMYI